MGKSSSEMHIRHMQRVGARGRGGRGKQNGRGAAASLSGHGRGAKTRKQLKNKRVFLFDVLLEMLEFMILHDTWSHAVATAATLS